MTKLAIPTRRNVNFDGDSDTEHYIGESSFLVSPTQAVWRISKLTYIGDSFTLRFADGDDAFDKIWDDRTTYTY